jgi:MFS family permease
MLCSPHLFTWQTKCTVLYIIGYASLAFIISGLGPLIPFKADESGIIETDYGIVFTFRGIGYLAGSIIVGKIEHMFNPHLLLTIYFFVLGSSAYLAVITQSIPLLAIIFLLNGIGCSGIDVLSQALTV